MNNTFILRYEILSFITYEQSVCMSVSVDINTQGPSIVSYFFGEQSCILESVTVN